MEGAAGAMHLAAGRDELARVVDVLVRRKEPVLELCRRRDQLEGRAGGVEPVRRVVVERSRGQDGIELCL